MGPQIGTCTAFPPDNWYTRSSGVLVFGWETGASTDVGAQAVCNGPRKPLARLPQVVSWCEWTASRASEPDFRIDPLSIRHDHSGRLDRPEARYRRFLGKGRPETGCRGTLYPPDARLSNLKKCAQAKKGPRAPRAGLSSVCIAVDACGLEIIDIQPPQKVSQVSRRPLSKEKCGCRQSSGTQGV